MTWDLVALHITVVLRRVKGFSGLLTLAMAISRNVKVLQLVSRAGFYTRFMYPVWENETLQIFCCLWECVFNIASCKINTYDPINSGWTELSPCKMRIFNLNEGSDSYCGLAILKEGIFGLFISLVRFKFHKNKQTLTSRVVVEQSFAKKFICSNKFRRNKAQQTNNNNTSITQESVEWMTSKG